MLSDLFQVIKPALAMVQLRPLPGSYRYRGEPLPAIIAAALDEVAVLAEAGFDGVQLQNMGDNPSTRHVGPETVAYMTAAALAIRQRFPDSLAEHPRQLGRRSGHRRRRRHRRRLRAR